jgi:hypothetical protein
VRLRLGSHALAASHGLAEKGKVAARAPAP